MQYQLNAPATLTGTLTLPASKSISNRALILNALSGGLNQPANLAVCDDTNVLIKALTDGSPRIDIGAAGTSMRFLTAYLTLQPGTWEITGTERMKNRPIGILVDALRALGASITYLEKDGYPPLSIAGCTLKGGSVNIDGGISSQYISALLMTGPCMQEGLILHLKDALISKPYTQMTLDMMAQYGIGYTWFGNDIHVPAQKYASIPYTVESDWSAASYWYEMISLTQNGSVFLNGLNQHSMQGDAKVAAYFSSLGVSTVYEATGVRIQQTTAHTLRFEADLTDQPDLAQTLVMTCALKGIPFHIQGLKSLKIKETDRIAALISEGQKVGFLFRELPGIGLSWTGERCTPQAKPVVETYEDHRMAMSFAPAAFAIPSLRINHPEVVSKSYPGFWDDLTAVGFDIQPL